jgi:hypothetical protein
MRTNREDRLDEGGGLRANGPGPRDEPRGRPLQVALMGQGHVGRVGGVAPADRVAEVDGHALAAMEALDRRRGQPPVDLFVDERIGHRVVVPAQLDVIVDVDPGVDGPLAVDEGLGGERAESRRTGRAGWRGTGASGGH